MGRVALLALVVAVLAGGSARAMTVPEAKHRIYQSEPRMEVYAWHWNGCKKLSERHVRCYVRWKLEISEPGILKPFYLERVDAWPRRVFWEVEPN